MRTWVWATLAGGCAAVAGIAIHKLRPSPPPAATVVTTSAGPCERRPARLSLLPGFDHPPLLTHVDARVEVLWDGQPLSRSPTRVSPGTHSCVTRVDHRQVSQVRVEARPFQPLWVDVVYEEGLGALPLILGGRCVDCQVPLAPLTLGVVDPEKSPDPLLRGAALALRQHDWRGAQRQLQSVTLPRRDARFHRLAAMLYVSAHQPDSALAALTLAAQTDPALRDRLSLFLAQRAEEDRRKAALPLERWNALTETFAQLLQRFDALAPSASARTSQRLEELSGALKRANDQHDAGETQRILDAAQKAFDTWVVELRNQRPDDCAFQKAVLDAVEKPNG